MNGLPHADGTGLRLYSFSHCEAKYSGYKYAEIATVTGREILLSAKQLDRYCTTYSILGSKEICLDKSKVDCQVATWVCIVLFTGSSLFVLGGAWDGG